MASEPLLTRVPGGRRDRLSDYIMWFDDALPKHFCAQLVENFEGEPGEHVSHGRGLEPGLESSGWTELEISSRADAAFQGFFMAQIEKFLGIYNSHLELTLPLRDYHLYQELRIKRYRAGSGDSFQPHFDALGNLSHRYLVFLWYLNDVHEGGETEFCDLGIRVAARAGRLLMFPPYWMYQHAGLPPRSGDKYILSTYMMFPANAGARPWNVAPAQTLPERK